MNRTSGDDPQRGATSYNLRFTISWAARREDVWRRDQWLHVTSSICFLLHVMFAFFRWSWRWTTMGAWTPCRRSASAGLTNTRGTEPTKPQEQGEEKTKQTNDQKTIKSKQQINKHARDGTNKTARLRWVKPKQTNMYGTAMRLQLRVNILTRLSFQVSMLHDAQ